MDVQPIAAQHTRHQRRTFLLADGRQLGTVADEQHATAAVVEHKTDEVVEQSPTRPVKNRTGRQTDHRGLVNNK